ncbi:MAG: peptidoglycan editing factor PgeF [Aridibacter sp.]
MSVPIDKITNSSKFKIQSSKSENQSLTDLGFYWREKNGVKVLVCKVLEENGFANGFSTRLGGVSEFPENDLNLAGFGGDSDENIAENRKRFLDVFDEDFSLTTVWQVHGDGVKKVSDLESAKNTDEKFDALISDLPNLLVGVKTADCVPILIGDTKTGAFSAIHAGWRGTVESIVVKGFEKMKTEYGTNPADLICAIGPAASCRSYEVGQEVIDEFSAKFSTGGKLFTQTRKGHALIDLQNANKEQLVSIGVPEQNIFIAPFCTMERTDLFFSYRIENKKSGKTGRLMSVIGKLISKVL